MSNVNQTRIINHLRNVLFNLNWSNIQCTQCSWVDHVDRFTRCEVCDEYFCGNCQCVHSPGTSSDTDAGSNSEPKTKRARFEEDVEEQESQFQVVPEHQADS